MTQGETEMSITPADKERCQAEIPNGAGAFTVGGVYMMVRCSEVPRVIVKERQAGDDGLHGEMSLCPECLEVFKKQMPLLDFSVAELAIYVRPCQECGEQLTVTNNFCSLLCAERFNESEDAALSQQQEEESSYIRSNCYGRLHQ